MARPVSRAFVDKVLKKQLKVREQFMELVELSVEDQAEFFIKSFIFALGDTGFKEVQRLSENFSKYLASNNESTDLSPVQAADFLQRNGKTRTAKERQEEMKDIDLDANNRICLIEYLLLHYKVMVLREYFKRHEMEPTFDLSTDGVGLTGCGDLLLEELFTMPVGLSEELEQAIEEFMELKKSRNARERELTQKAALEGVQGLRAKNELAQFLSQDTTELNRVELTLQAAKRKAEKQTPEAVLAAKRAAEEKKEKEAKEKSRAALAARAAAFAGGGGA